MPLGQKRAVWIRTGNLSLIKRNALTTEPWLHIWDINCRNIAVYVVELQKRKLQPENMLWCVVAARQLWCWLSQRRYDLWTLMKCVCKVLIYHPPKNQHSIMILCCCSRPWMLWGSSHQESENINTLQWLLAHNRSVPNIRMVFEKCMNWLQNTPSSLSITSMIWELHPPPSRVLDGASAFFNLLVSLKYFYAQRVISTHISRCACSAQPAMTVSMTQDWVSMRVKQQTLSVHRINLHDNEAFLFRKACK